MIHFPIFQQRILVKGQAQGFSMQVVMNKCFLQNFEKKLVQIHQEKRKNTSEKLCHQIEG